MVEDQVCSSRNLISNILKIFLHWSCLKFNFTLTSRCPAATVQCLNHSWRLEDKTLETSSFRLDPPPPFGFLSNKLFAVKLNSNLSPISQLNSLILVLRRRVKNSFSGLIPPSFTPSSPEWRESHRDGDGKAGRGGPTAWSLFVPLEKPAALLSASASTPSGRLPSVCPGGGAAGNLVGSVTLLLAEVI